MSTSPVPVRPSTARHVLRYLTLLTAVANAGGNVAIFFFYRPIFELLGVPLPEDLFSFVFVSCFSFTVAVLVSEGADVGFMSVGALITFRLG